MDSLDEARWGTAFQVEVWETLRTIRPGEPASYGEVAKQMGRPTAHRAAEAAACESTKP
ncbi:MAG: O6-methylguanine-DNA--protein-cysteine methyltransferase [Acidimicrobiales bacterium]|jgi:methylated-DNA-[protein]-cysteine S-methyltransferase